MVVILAHLSNGQMGLEGRNLDHMNGESNKFLVKQWLTNLCETGWSVSFNGLTASLGCSTMVQPLNGLFY